MGRKGQNEIKQNKEPKSDKKVMPKRKWNKQGAHQKHKKRKSDEVKEKPKLSKSDTKKAVY